MKIEGRKGKEDLGTLFQLWNKRGEIPIKKSTRENEQEKGLEIPNLEEHLLLSLKVNEKGRETLLIRRGEGRKKGKGKGEC